MHGRLLCLVALCCSARLALGVPPPPLEDTFALGSRVRVPAACGSSLAFRPSGSAATLRAGSFEVDVAGDYSACGKRWRGMEMPRAMGQSSPVRFTDGFTAKSVHDSDSKMGAWEYMSDIASCEASHEKGRGLQLHSTASAACGLRTRTEGVNSLFSEPLTLVVSGLVLNASTAYVGFGLLGVRLTRSKGKLLALVTDGSSASARVLRRQPTECTEASSIDLSLSANSVNVSLRVQCAGHSVLTGAPATVWNGAGHAHGLTCPHSERQACGTDALRLALLDAGSASLQKVELRSCLVPGSDPLRPGVSIASYPAVLWPITDELGTSSAPLGASQPRASEGILDASMPPFSADPSGKTDSTAQLQAAVDYAREHYMLVFLPSGTYSVTDTIVLRSVSRSMSTGHIPGPVAPGSFTSDFLLDGVSSRYVPNYLRGSTLGAGTTIVLKPRSAGFQDASKPRYVLDFLFVNAMGQQEPNAQYNSMATDLTVEVGAGNYGAVGVRLRGAQGSGLEDVTVHTGDGLAGVVGGCGSGGAHHGLTVTGGRYGLDLRQSQPTGTVSGTTLRGQRCAALVYGGFESLSAVGINITSSSCHAVLSTDNVGSLPFNVPGGGSECALPYMPPSELYPINAQPTNPAILGKMLFVDSSVRFEQAKEGQAMAQACAASRTAFSVVRSLFLQNVYVHGADTVMSAPANVSVAGERGGGVLVSQLVHGIDPPKAGGKWQVHAAIYIDGVRQASQTRHSLRKLGAGEGVPRELVSQHRWGAAFPNFESPACANAKTAGGAVGDGTSDDYKAIQDLLDGGGCVFLPRGVYVVSRPLQIHPGGALVGVARHLTRITSADAGLAPPRHYNAAARSHAATGVRPVVESLPGRGVGGKGKGKPSVLAFLSISIWNHLNDTSALHWYADEGVYRQAHTNRANRCGSLKGPGCANSTRINYPLQRVSGCESWKAYTWFNEDCCHEHVTTVAGHKPAVGPAYWGGFLAGPQGPHYRHLLLEGVRKASFYHLNCEHGTGEAICEFANHTTNVSVYGLKTEGNFVTLWVRDCDHISVFGTGGCGCSANDTVYPPDFVKMPPTLYRVERTPHFLLANIIDQDPFRALSAGDFNQRPRDMFDESGCPPEITNIIYAQQEGAKPVLTRPLDRPAMYSQGY